MNIIENVVGIVIIITLLAVLILRRWKRRASVEKEKSEEKRAAAHQKKVRDTRLKIIAGRNNTDRKLIDYGSYTLSLREWLTTVIMVGAVFALIGYIFYEKWWVVLIVSLFSLLAPIWQRKKLLNNRKHILNLQFKEAIQSLSSSLAAGRSAESAFKEVASDLRLLYPDPNTYILREFDIINRRVENGDTLERAIEDFAQRSDVEDIQNFADVFITCKRTGGSLVEVIQRTATIIGDKLEIQQDIQVQISQKKFESQILNVMPVAMVLLLKVTSGDYLDPLYDWNGAGPIVMTVCLMLLIGALLLGQKIMNIEM